MIRHDDSEQERVLEVIHEALRESEPEPQETNALAHLAWEWRCERLRLELDPDAALERLSALAASPLGTAIRQDLATIAVPERAEVSEAVVIPLRRKPATRRGMQRLLGLAPRCGIGHGEAYPVGPAHRRALAGSVMLASLLLGWSAWSYFFRSPGDVNLTVKGVNSSQVRLVSGTGQRSVPHIDLRGTSHFFWIPANSRQKLWFLEGGYVWKEQVEIGRSNLWVFVEQRGLVLPCSYSLAEIGPQHEVTMPTPFALGRFEVILEEYDRFAKATDRPLPEDKGWGRGRQPAINVSFDDARAYAEWLSKETGQTYRLPSEAEWEYAARAGTETEYWWGPDVGKNQANCVGCGSRWDGKQPAPVGSFAPNPYGLFDTAGNMWEWVEDCHHSTYTGAPVDGRPWAEACGSRVLRGGSWFYGPRWLRSAYRGWLIPDDRLAGVGFRLARTL